MSVPRSSSETGDQRLDVLEKRLGYTFSDYSNLKRALTHSSVRTVSEENFHYERLEFLGDRVLGLCVALLLHHEFPDADEGELSLRLKRPGQGKNLGKYCR